MINRRKLIGGTAALTAMVATRPLAAKTIQPADTDWHALGEKVKGEMAWAWDQYHAIAWGKDEIKPVSGTYSTFSGKHHLGLSLIEALDTLWLMGLDDQFNAGVDWVKANLDFDVDLEVSVFESSIRLVGGLLSAYLISYDPVLLDRARDLANRLSPAFETPTGMPWRFINLKTGKLREPVTSPADIGTYLPEWGTLSQLTGDNSYRDRVRRAALAVYERRSSLDLIATKIDARTGEWATSRATVGSYCDSFFEYLWDSWDLLGDKEMKAMYDVCTAAILKHQQVWKDGNLWFVDVDFETGKTVSTRQDELASFYGGLLSQGGNTKLGAAYTESWAKVQDRFGILPEEYDFETAKATQVTNALRPELVDAAFTLWLGDQNPRWREIGKQHFEAMMRWNKAPHGYTDMADVTSSPKRQADHCPGYWWSEQMKYYYLLFSDTSRFDYARNVLTTEGNVLRGAIARPVPCG